MIKKDKIDEIRSDEVQAILGHVPNWIIRWGISVMFLLIVMLLAVSWVVKYPDYIEGAIVLKTKKSSVNLFSKNTGLLKQLNLNAGDTVYKGQNIASIENLTSNATVSWMYKQISIVDSLLTTENHIDLQNIVDRKAGQLGALQKNYSELTVQCNELAVISLNSFNNDRIKNIKKQIEYYSQLVTISHRKLKLGEKELNNIHTNYQAQRTLFEKGFISKTEYNQKENVLFQSQHQLESYKQDYVQNCITLTDYKKQLSELEFAIDDKKRKLIENIKNSIQLISNQLQAWRHNFTLVSPIDGILQFKQPLNANKHIINGDPLFTITPIDNHFIAVMTVSSIGFGKVKEGQKVYVKLDNYPYQQFGQVIGEVEKKHNIATIDNTNNSSSNYVEISFSNPKITTYHQNILLNPENTGTAQIVTENRRIIERLFGFLREKIVR